MYAFFPSFGQSSISPNHISGLQLWLSADSGASLNGTHVSQWADRSGNSRNAYANSSIYQPQFVNTVPILNNRPTLNFYFNPPDTSLLQINNSINVGEMFILANWDAGNTFPDYNGLLSAFTGTYLIIGSGGSSSLLPSNYFDNLFIDTIQALNFTPFSRYKIISGRKINPSLLPNLQIGKDRAIASRFWQGNVSELIIYDHALSNSQRDSIYKYFQNKYTPPVSIGSITVNYGFCPTISISAYKPWFTSYQWSTGQTTDTIVTSLTGHIFVTTKDIFGFTSSDTMKVIYPGNLSPFPKNKTICMGDTLVWNTQLNKKGYHFIWQDNSTDSLFKITNAGQYYVKVTDTIGGTGCSINSYTLTVSVDNFPQTASLGAATTICSGASIALISGANPANTYTWSTGATTSSIIITTTNTYSLTVQDGNGCIAKDTIHVDVKGVNPIPNFNVPNSCFGSLTNFTDQSTVTLPAHINQWSWNFGDATPITTGIPNPSHSYSVAGTYTATLTVTSDSGCTATIQKIDTVNAQPTASFYTSLPLCSETNISYVDQSTVTLPAHLNQWSWDFGDGTLFVSQQNPIHTYSSAGTYSVQLIVSSDKGCTDTVNAHETVHPIPIPSFTADTVCLGTGTHFSGTSTGVITTWYWQFGDGTNSATNHTTTHTYLTAGTHSVTLTVTSDSGCYKSYTDTVKVNFLPKSKFVSDSICVFAPLQFKDSSTVSGSTISSWHWQFGSMGSSTQQNPVATFTSSGTYSVTLSVTSAQGCIGFSSQLVQVMPLPVPDFNFSPQYGALPLTVNFHNQSSGALNYLWSFSDGGHSTLDSLSHVYQNPGVYYIKLLSESKLGCKDSLTEKLQIDEPILDVDDSMVWVTQQPNSVQPYVLLYNKGNIDVHSIQLSAYLDDGNPVMETWTGTLTPTSPNWMYYKFNSSLEIVSNKNHNIICVDVLLVNGRVDDNVLNNHACTAITNNFTLLDPFPNPTNGDIYFLLILPQEGSITLDIYDMIGRKVKVISENGLKGLNQITYSTLGLSKGNYYLQLNYNDKVLGKMFMKD